MGRERHERLPKWLWLFDLALSGTTAAMAAGALALVGVSFWWTFWVGCIVCFLCLACVQVGTP